MRSQANWGPEPARAVAVACCERIGVAPDALELVSFRQNALYRHRGYRLVVRVYGPEDAHYKARTMVAFARHLEKRRFPAIRLAPRVADQPLEVLGHPVSVWQWIDSPEPDRISYRELGAVLRRLHDAGGDFASPLRQFDPIAKIERRLARLRVLARVDADSLDVLDAVLAGVAGPFERARAADSTRVVVHGDALAGNALPTADGLVLIDFDSIARAPPAWDLAPTRAAIRYFGLRASAWEELVQGYGVDEACVVGVDAMVTVKALSITVVLCLSAGRSERIDREIAHRIAGWAARDPNPRWRHPGRR